MPSPRQTGKIQIGWVVCEMGRKSAHRLHSEGADQWFLPAGHKWDPPGINTGPTVFNIFRNGLDNETERSLAQFADEMKLCDKVDMSEGRTILQSSLDRLEEWAGKNCAKFYKNKCDVLKLE